MGHALTKVFDKLALHSPSDREELIGLYDLNEGDKRRVLEALDIHDKKVRSDMLNAIEKTPDADFDRIKKEIDRAQGELSKEYYRQVEEYSKKFAEQCKRADENGNKYIVPMKCAPILLADTEDNRKTWPEAFRPARCSTCDRDLEQGRCYSCLDERDAFHRRHNADPDFSIDIDDIIAGMRQWSPVK